MGRSAARPDLELRSNLADLEVELARYRLDLAREIEARRRAEARLDARSREIDELRAELRAARGQRPDLPGEVPGEIGLRSGEVGPQPPPPLRLPRGAECARELSPPSAAAVQQRSDLLERCLALTRSGLTLTRAGLLEAASRSRDAWRATDAAADADADAAAADAADAADADAAAADADAADAADADDDAGLVEVETEHGGAWHGSASPDGALQRHGVAGGERSRKGGGEVEGEGGREVEGEGGRELERLRTAAEAAGAEAAALLSAVIVANGEVTLTLTLTLVLTLTLTLILTPTLTLP